MRNSPARIVTLRAIIALLAGFCVVGCSPALNWRQVPIGGLSSLLPCKPDSASRMVAFASTQLLVKMLGCEASGALFAISQTRASSNLQAQQVMQQWQQAALAKMHAATVQALPAKPLKGHADGTPQAQVMLQVSGFREDGAPVQAQFLWRVIDTEIYHWVVYAEKIDSERVEPLFNSTQSH